MGMWDDHEQAKADMLQEHVDKMGPEEIPGKATVKQLLLGGPKNETWSETGKRWVQQFVDQKNKKGRVLD